MIYLLLFLTFLNGSIALAESIKIKKLKPSYEFEDGLYEIRNELEGTVLYLFKDGRNIVMRSMTEILHSTECGKGGYDSNFINNIRGSK